MPAKKCKYESEFSKCDLPIWRKDNSYCIFHSEMIEEKKDNFEKKFESYLKTLEEEPEKFNYIDGFIFPDTFKLRDVKRFSVLRFFNCKFGGDVDLFRCEFDSDFGISKSIIHGNVKIEWSNFNKLFVFYRNQVKGNFFFHASSVKSNALLIESEINDFILLRWSYFMGQVEIVDMRTNKAWHIHGVDFSSANRARFRNINFTEVYLFDSKLVDVDFIGTTWKVENGRFVIGDEIVFRTKQIPPRYPIKDFQSLIETGSIVESLYLQLCANYDKKRLFDISGKFYISAMEMRRQSHSNWFKQNLFSWEAWYKYISNYGQSSTRAFWGIMLILVLCSIIISFDTNLYQINNGLNLEISFQSISSTLNIFLRSIKYNLYYLIHPAEWTFKDQISLTAFVTAWERIIVIVLGAFFLLALRRRFRRI